MAMNLTVEQAVSVLPDKTTISAFRRRGLWPLRLEHYDQESIREVIVKAELLQIAGPAAHSKGYGLCAVIENTQIAHVLFIESDMVRLRALWASQWE